MEHNGFLSFPSALKVIYFKFYQAPNDCFIELKLFDSNKRPII